MNILRKIKFKDFITLQRGFDLPSSKRVEGKYPVVAATSINGYHNQYKNEPPGVEMKISVKLVTYSYPNSSQEK